ncbi:MAG: DMT family transporter [Gammaproteobacteria bacterium]|nr:DMT family transporter [Gammaproteobacteria bacterium]
MSILFYSMQTTIIKFYSATLPPLPMVIFIQSTVSLVLMLPFLLKKKVVKEALVFNDFPLHVLRMIFSISISYLLFYSVTLVSLVNATLLVNTAPLFVPLFAYVFLSKKINHGLWIPLLIGFTGVVIVLHPGGGKLHPALLLALVAGMSWASSILAVRQLSKKNSTQVTTLYFFILSTIFSGIISIKFWVPISMPMLLVSMLLGVLYFLVQYTATWALKHAGAELFGILSYSNIIFVSFFSILLWQLIPSRITMIGMACIAIGGILSILVEYRKRTEKISQSNSVLTRAMDGPSQN